jgi:hypothetical protein
VFDLESAFGENPAKSGRKTGGVHVPGADVQLEPSETLRNQRQPDGKRRPDLQPRPSPSPQQPRPMTSLQLWLNKPKIDQRVQELER